MFEMRPIPGFEDVYSVTIDGRIWSHRNGGRWLKPIKHSAGYLTVNLYLDQQCIRMLTHRAVAMAWLPPPRRDQVEVNHKDGNKTNTHAENLEWVTVSENKHHAYRMGLMPRRTPRRAAATIAHNRTKRRLTDEQIACVRELLIACVAQKAIAKQFAVSQATISHINSGTIYRD